MSNDAKNGSRIFMGFPEAGRLTHANPIGVALTPVGRRYHVVRLWAFPRVGYYLVPHGSDFERKYTLFGRKRDGKAGALHFENPIGNGDPCRSLPGFIEVRMTFPRVTFYLKADETADVQASREQTAANVVAINR